jgi:hypothetical protein
VTGRGHGLLSGVSCWSVKRCFVVGDYFPNKHAIVKPVALAESWNGTKWTASKPPSVAPSPRLADVSCVSSSSCLAVGVTAVAPETERSFADSWNGKKWIRVAVAVPENGTGKTGPYPNSYILGTVTCAAAADCVAFGIAGPLQYFPKLSNIAEAYNGKRLSNIADSKPPRGVFGPRTMISALAASLIERGSSVCRDWRDADAHASDHVRSAV